MKGPISHAVAEEANLHVKEVKKTIGTLFEVMVRELRAGGRCAIPNIVILVARKKSGFRSAEEERVREDLCVPSQTGEDSRWRKGREAFA